MSNKIKTWSRFCALFGSTVAAFALLVLLAPQTYAAAGEGTATVDIGTGGTGADDATYGGAAGTGSVTVGDKTYVKIDLTVGATGIAAAQNNVTAQVTANLFPATTWELAAEAALGDLDAVGEWFITYTDTDSVTTDNGSISFAASAAVNTGLITIQADQIMDPTDIIHIYAVVQDDNIFLAATPFVIQTDDTGADTLAGIGVPITISTAAASADASIVKATPTVGSSGDLVLTLDIPRDLIVGDKINITFPTSYTVANTTATIAFGSISPNTGNATFNVTAGGQILTLTVATATLDKSTTTSTIVIPGADAIPQYVDTTDITVFTVQTAGSVNIATDTTVAFTDTVAADAAASLALSTNSVVGNAGNSTLTFTIPIDMADNDTVSFTAPSLLNVASVAYSSDTFTGNFDACTPFGQVIICAANGVVTAGTGTIVMTGILSVAGGSSTITAIAVNDTTAGGADMAADASGAVTAITSNQSDSNAPAAPTGVALTTSAGKVVITWTDPSDSDLSAVEILRGVGSLPVSGTTYDSVGKGVQTYTDTDVTAGSSVKYILRSRDSSGNVSLSAEYSITVSAGAATTTTTTSTPATTTTTTTTTTQTQTQTQSQNRYGQAGVSESEVDSAVGSFSDLLKDAWFAPFIARMNNLDILSGYPDGTVKPDDTINRAELAKMSAMAFDLSTSISQSFSDVPSDAWFAPFVGALQKVNAILTTTNAYQPGEDVTRGEALWTLLTAAGVNLDGVTVTKIFPDVSTRHRFAAAITYAFEHGIINGYDNGNFGPGDTLTRGQVAKIVSLLKDL